MYVRELHVRYRKHRVGRRSLPERVESSADAGRVFVDLLGHESVEVCGLLCLSACHQLLAYHELSRGTLMEALVHPREVLKVALLANAATVLIGHNHPSGDPTPSRSDIDVTRRLRLAGELMGIDLADHLVVGFDRYVSLRDLGQF